MAGAKKTMKAAAAALAARRNSCENEMKAKRSSINKCETTNGAAKAKEEGGAGVWRNVASLAKMASCRQLIVAIILK